MGGDPQDRAQELNGGSEKRAILRARIGGRLITGRTALPLSCDWHKPLSLSFAAIHHLVQEKLTSIFLCSQDHRKVFRCREKDFTQHALW